MKSALVVILCLPTSGLAQDESAIAAAQSACGPKQVKFDAKQDSSQHPTPQPDPDKALVYVIEDLGECLDCYARYTLYDIASDVSGAVTKVGIDGSWIGANKANSYLFFSTTPGEHHLCANWQSSLEDRAHAFALFGFTAEAGKTYYFRLRLFPGYAAFSFDLGMVNNDEGKFLVASSPYSVSHAKK
jgi:hypothetical protein